MKRLWLLFCLAWVALVMAACGGGGSSSTATIPPPTTTLSAPLELAVEPSDGTNTVVWLAVPGATSYTIYWSETAPVDRTTANKITNAVSPYKHTGLVNGKMLYYAVVAVGTGGESGLSNQVGAAPGANLPSSPVSLSAVPGNGSVELSWSAVSGAVTYNIYWSQSPSPVPGGPGVTKIAGVTGTFFTHTGLTNGQTYYYIVTAVNANGEGGQSKAASAVPSLSAIGRPSNLTATSGDQQVRLLWTATSDAISYNVYWSLTPGVVPGGTNVTKIEGITAANYLHTGLTNGTTYYYVVTSVSSGGESAASTEVSAKALPPPPPPPQGLTAIAARDAASVTLQWFDVTGYPTAEAPIQLGYHLYRGNQPGLASYYKDTTRATKISAVTAPFIDASVVSGATYYYVAVAYVPQFPEVEGAPSGEVSATVGNAGGGGGGGGEDTSSFGANLSFPVVFADGYGISGTPITGAWPGIGPFETVPTFDFNTGLRPLSTETLASYPFADPTTAVVINTVTYYPQATASTWQGEWRSNSTGAQMDVVVDWGDSLLSKTYTANSIVRIETVLKQDTTVGVTDTMKAYTMKLLSGTGATELQGTDMTTYDSNTRNVFTVNARLKIEKLSTDGSTATVLFDKAVWEGFGAAAEGSDSDVYGAEINQGGSVVYGYNLMINKLTLPTLTGQYRITFSLDPTATIGDASVSNHVKMVSKTDAGATLSTDGKSTSVTITVN